MSHAWRRAAGSKPVVGSSRKISSGSPISASARSSRRYRVAWRDADGTPHVRESEDPTPLLYELTGEALARGERVHQLSVTQPSLEDVYLELTE